MDLYVEYVLIITRGMGRTRVHVHQGILHPWLQVHFMSSPPPTHMSHTYTCAIVTVCNAMNDSTSLHERAFTDTVDFHTSFISTHMHTHTHTHNSPPPPFLLLHCYQDNCPTIPGKSPSSWSSVLGTWDFSPIHRVLL